MKSSLARLLVATARNLPGVTDGELLNLYAERRDETAFAVVYGRHERRVLQVCRCLLGNEEEALDAFQATFCVLARKAGRLIGRKTVGPWLSRTATQTALHARRTLARRRRREAKVLRKEAVSPADAEAMREEVAAAVLEEISRLPERYAAPLVLCLIEGVERERAAQKLGWTENQVRHGLERGREVLRHRLARRGLVLTAPLVLVAVPAGSSVATAALAGATLHAVLGFAAGGSVSPRVAALAAESLRGTAARTTIRLAGAALLLVGIAAGAGGYYAATRDIGHAAAEPAAPALVPRPAPAQEAEEPGGRKPDAREWRRQRLNATVVPRIIEDLEKLAGKVTLVRAEESEDRAEVDVSWDPGVGPKRPWRLFMKFFYADDRFEMWRLQAGETERDLFLLDPEKPLYWQGWNDNIRIVIGREEVKDINDAFRLLLRE